MSQQVKDNKWVRHLRLNTGKIISKFDFENFFIILQERGAKNVVLFCVEERAEACHRSLVTQVLNEKYEYKIKHL